MASTRTGGRGATAARGFSAGALATAAATLARAGAVRAVRVARDGGAGRLARGAGDADAVPPPDNAGAVGATVGKAGSAGATAVTVLTKGGSASRVTVRLSRVGQPTLSVTVSTGSSTTVVVLMRRMLSVESPPCMTRTRTDSGATRTSPDRTVALAHSAPRVSPSARLMGTARFKACPRTTLERIDPKPSAAALPPLASATTAMKTWGQPMCMPRV